MHSTALQPSRKNLDSGKENAYQPKVWLHSREEAARARATTLSELPGERFEIVIDEIQAAYKLSQNRDETSYHNVIAELEQGDEAARKVAGEMGKRNDHL